MKTIELTDSQANAVGMAIESIESRAPLFRIAGYAGTGKTSILSEIIDAVSGSAVCAFTGKAASVLRSKGLCGATTIHKAIYRYDPVRDEFILKSRDEMEGISFFLLDEASMVSQKHWDDMCSFGKPIVAVGDPGQLEPVGDDPRLMHDADVVLTEIHRQATDSEIIQFATHIRMGGYIGKGSNGCVEVGARNLFWDDLEWADVLLCGFNRTRVRTNSMMRLKRLGATACKKKLQVGDKIVCLKNDYKLGVYNGELFTVVSVMGKGGSRECVLSDCDGYPRRMMVSLEAFGVDSPDKRSWREPNVMYADYGYCLSLHKFQGSEADKVSVLHEACDLWDQKRWSYTAATRAAKELRYAI